jgi:hypothetical protein
MKLCDLNPSTAHIVRMLVLELAAYKRSASGGSNLMCPCLIYFPICPFLFNF